MGKLNVNLVKNLSKYYYSLYEHIFSVFFLYFLQILKLRFIIITYSYITILNKAFKNPLTVPIINQNKKQPRGVAKDLLCRTVRIAITCERSLIPVKNDATFACKFSKMNHSRCPCLVVHWQQPQHPPVPCHPCRRWLSPVPPPCT